MTEILNLNSLTAIERYNLQQKLPQFAKVKQQENVKKNYKYYHDNFNVWNNPHQSSQKNYNFYHQYNDTYQDQINLKKEQQYHQKQISNQEHIQYCQEQRQLDLQRFYKRKLERTALQIQCSQKLFLQSQQQQKPQAFQQQPQSLPQPLPQQQQPYKQSSILSKDNCPSGAELQKLFKQTTYDKEMSQTGRAPNLWNKLNGMSRKQLDNVINPHIIQNDEKAINQIQNRLMKEQEEESIRTTCFRKFRDIIRMQLLNRHEQNYQLEKMSGQIPKQKPHIIRKEKTTIRQHQEHKNLTSVNQTFSPKQNVSFYNPYMPNNSISYPHNQQFTQNNTAYNNMNNNFNNFYDEAASKNNTLLNSFHNSTSSGDAHITLKRKRSSKSVSQQNFPNIKNLVKIENENELMNNEDNMEIEDYQFNVVENSSSQQQDRNTAINRLSEQEQNLNSEKQDILKKKRSISEQQHRSQLCRQNKQLGNEQQQCNPLIYKTSNDAEQISRMHEPSNIVTQYFEPFDQQRSKQIFSSNITPKKDSKLNSITIDYSFKNTQNVIFKPIDHQLPVVKRLSQVRKPFNPKNNLDRTDYKGLLTSEVNDKFNNQYNQFNQTMLNKSKLVANNLSKIERNGSSSIQQSKFGSQTKNLTEFQADLINKMTLNSIYGQVAPSAGGAKQQDQNSTQQGIQEYIQNSQLIQDLSKFENNLNKQRQKESYNRKNLEDDKLSLIPKELLNDNSYINLIRKSQFN